MEAADELFEIGHQISTGQGDVSDLSENAAKVSIREGAGVLEPSNPNPNSEVAGLLEAEGKIEEAKRVMASAQHLRNVARASEAAKIAELGLEKDHLQDTVETMNEKMAMMQVDNPLVS